MKQFIKEHAEDDLSRLLLGAGRYPEVDVPFAVEQISARRQIRDKLPGWYGNDDLIFPAKVAAEQCSSERTAFYKLRLIGTDVHLCDLTGGLGVDSYFFSQKAKQITYIERIPGYCDVARHNFSVLGADHIRVVEGDATRLFPEIPGVDIFYIDPARRDSGNRRVFALQACEPDLSSLLPALLRHAPEVIAKLSPMADICQTLSLLPGTTEIHVVSVKNETKELLFVIKREGQTNDPAVYCWNYTPEGKEELFSFTLAEEKEAVATYASHVKTYLYEPNSSLLKAGSFRAACRLGVEKLHKSSHLYTSDQLITDFPGRRFVVEKTLPFNNKLCKTLVRTIPRANITVRNFPLPVEGLRKRTKIAEGGPVYLFATTLKDNQKVIIKGRK